MGIKRSLARVGRVAAALTIAFCATDARADWKLYGGFDVGYSVGHGDAGGVFTQPANDLGGSDDDTSPLIGGTFGVTMPLSEATPWDLPFRWRLPGWNVRAELEAVGLREYDFKTHGVVGPTGETPAGSFNSQLEVWTLTQNLWLDVPLRGLYRPVSWTSARLFGRWRLSGLKEFLDRTSLTMGAGVGVGHLDLKTADGQSSGSDDRYNFVWQAGAGLDYLLTDRVHLVTGYRYLDVGDVDFDLRDAPEGSRFKMDTTIHEFRAGIRVDFYSFETPWR